MTSIDEETFLMSEWGEKLVKKINRNWKERGAEMNSAAWAGDPLLWKIKQRKGLKGRKRKAKEKKSTLGLLYCRLSQQAAVFTKKRGEGEGGYISLWEERGDSDGLMYSMF